MCIYKTSTKEESTAKRSRIRKRPIVNKPCELVTQNYRIPVDSGTVKLFMLIQKDINGRHEFNGHDEVCVSPIVELKLFLE